MDVSEADGFERWYQAEHARVITVLAAVTGDADVASEASDEAFARAYQRWDRVGAMESRSGWVYRTALNEARRRLRRRSMEQRLWRKRSDPPVVPGPTGELWLLVASLPARQREAVALRHVAHLTESEVAQAMSITRGTVSSTLRDAYRSLGSALEAQPVEVEGSST